MFNQKAEEWSHQSTHMPSPPSSSSSVTVHVLCPAFTLPHFVSWYVSASCTMPVVSFFSNLLLFPVLTLHRILSLALHLPMSLCCNGGFSTHMTSCECGGVVYKNLWHITSAIMATFFPFVVDIYVSCSFEDGPKHCNFVRTKNYFCVILNCIGIFFSLTQMIQQWCFH